MTSNRDVVSESSGNAQKSTNQELPEGRLARLFKHLDKGRYAFPPTLTCLDIILLIASWFFSFIALCYLLLRFCTDILAQYGDTFCDYVAIFILPFGFFVDRYIRRNTIIHRLRLKDHSEVEALLIEAKNVEHRLKGTDAYDCDEKTDIANFKANKRKLVEEVGRLENTPENWTEYEILNLEQLLVDFLKVDELKERATSQLDDLEEYASDSKVSYDLRQYDRWKERIRDYTEQIDNSSRSKEGGKIKPKKQDRNAEPLRASVKTLQEHIASYRQSWAEGTWIVRSLIICCGITIPILIALGTLPRLHPSFSTDEQLLQFYNWGFLGTSGSLTGVILALRKSNVTEVGATEGKSELWQMLIGTALGFVAGVLMHSMISGGFLSGELVPKLNTCYATDFGRSIVWAFAAGFAFERVYDKVRTEVNSG